MFSFLAFAGHFEFGRFIIIIIIILILPVVGFFGLYLDSIQWQQIVNAYLFPYAFFLTNFCFVLDKFPYIPGYAVTPWSVAIEKQFYIVWGGLLSKMKNLKTLWLIVFFGMLTTLLLRWFTQSHSEAHRYFYYNTFSRLDAIFVGIAVALMLHQRLQIAGTLNKYGFIFILTPILF